MKKIISRISSIFADRKSAVTMDELIGYPKDTLGFHLGSFLFHNSHDMDPQPDMSETHRVLINHEVSSKEERAMHFYLFGNGDYALKNLFVMASGTLIFPLHLLYFYKRYRDGRNALRFYDLDHFRMLHLPVKRIKDTFLIR